MSPYRLTFLNVCNIHMVSDGNHFFARLLFFWAIMEMWP
jgi:hypothetical protein